MSVTTRRLHPDDPRRPLLLAWWGWDAHPGDPSKIKALDVQVKAMAAGLGLGVLPLRRAMAEAKRTGRDYIDALDLTFEALGVDPSEAVRILSTPVDPPPQGDPA